MPAPRKDMPQLMDALAERVANGEPLIEAGAAMGLTRGQTTNVWGHVKAGLGAQAS